MDFSTPEFRAEEYKKHQQPKKGSLKCPICDVFLISQYALANHFLKRIKGTGLVFKDPEHEKYWIELKNKKKEEYRKSLENKIHSRTCIRCGKNFKLDSVHKFQKRCDACTLKYPPRVKKATNKIKLFPCSICKKLITVKSHSTNRICAECKKKKREEYINKNLSIPIVVSCIRCNEPVVYYKKHTRDRASRMICEKCKKDSLWFLKDSDYERVINLLKTTSLTRREIKSLLNLKKDYIKEAATYFFGQKWYTKRVKKIKERGLLQSKFERPSQLEKLFSKELKIPFLSNQWIVLCINGIKKRKEIDIKIPIKEKKFAIFIDGRAFHGENNYFNPTNVKEDILVAEKLAEMGYYSIRYSEEEVRGNRAQYHFQKIYDKFLKSPPKYYYKNWIDNKEILY